MDQNDRLPNGSPSRDADVSSDSPPACGEGPQELEAPYEHGSEAVDFVLRRGRSVYRVAVDIRKDLDDRDLTWERFLEIALSAGEILAMPAGIKDPDRRPENDVSFTFIFASVLSRDLVAEALALPRRHVELLAEPAAESRLTAPGETVPCEYTDSGSLTAETARGLPLGEVLIRLGADALAVAWVLREQVCGDDRPIGDILVAGGRVCAELRDEAVRLQQCAEATGEADPSPEAGHPNACVAYDSGTRSTH